MKYLIFYSIFSLLILLLAWSYHEFQSPRPLYKYADTSYYLEYDIDGERYIREKPEYLIRYSHANLEYESSVSKNTWNNTEVPIKWSH